MFLTIFTGNLGSAMRKEHTKELLEQMEKICNAGVFGSPKIADISKKTGIPGKKLSSVIKELHKLKYMKIVVSLNYEKLPITVAEVAIKSAHPDFNEEIFNTLKEIEYVEDIAAVSGEISHFFSIMTPSMKELNTGIQKFKNSLNDKIEYTVTMPVYEYYWDEGTFFPKMDHGKVKLDEKDWQLLSLLKKDAMMPLTELGERMELRAPTVHRRIKMLKDRGVINGFIGSRIWENVPKKHLPIRMIFDIKYSASSELKRELIEEILAKKTGMLAFAFTAFGGAGVFFCLRANSLAAIQKFMNTHLVKGKRIFDVKSYLVLNSARRNVFDDFAKVADKFL